VPSHTTAACCLPPVGPAFRSRLAGHRGHHAQPGRCVRGRGAVYAGGQRAARTAPVQARGSHRLCGALALAATCCGGGRGALLVPKLTIASAGALHTAWHTHALSRSGVRGGMAEPQVPLRAARERGRAPGAGRGDLGRGGAVLRPPLRAAPRRVPGHALALARVSSAQVTVTVTVTP
jgi:hypothetical protein